MVGTERVKGMMKEGWVEVHEARTWTSCSRRNSIPCDDNDEPAGGGHGGGSGREMGIISSSDAIR